MIALSEQITASLILFIRQGSWALVIVVVMALDTAGRQLELVMAAWTVAGGLAAALGLWRVLRLQMGGWRRPIDWGWVRRGVAVSMSFLLATLALRGVQTFDRYWLANLAGIELVGAYVLFFGVASTLMVFLDSGLFSYAYPELINLHHQQQHQLVQRKIRVMLTYTLIFSTGFAVVSWLLLPYLLDWIGESVYLQSIYLYPWLLFAMVVNAISMVPHLALYACGYDKPIIYSHIAALCAFAVATWALASYWPTLAVPIGLNVSFFVMLAWKSVAYWHAMRTSPTKKPATQSA